jgi:hypothetical protein
MLKWILITILASLLFIVWDSVNPYPEKEKPWTEWDTIFVYVYMAIVLLSLLSYFEVI